MKTAVIIWVTVAFMVLISAVSLHNGWGTHVTLLDGAIVAAVLFLASINIMLAALVKHVIELVKQAIILNATTPERIDAAKTGRYKLFPHQS